nr:MAG TPA: Pyocin activator protein PrtN [Caudoviricetes sp.]
MSDMELLEEIRRMDTAFITPAQAARVTHCSPDYIRVAARQQFPPLPFPVMVVGNRTKIPRIPFLRAFGVEEDER